MRGRSEDEEDDFFLRGAAGGAGVAVAVAVGGTWGLCIAVNGDLCSGLSGSGFHG